MEEYSKYNNSSTKGFSSLFSKYCIMFCNFVVAIMDGYWIG